jgi:hypothetical protein
VFSLSTIETRVKRARVVDALNRLRAVAHIVDMKQPLTLKRLTAVLTRLHRQ